MTATVAGIHLGPDTHANRPAANTAPAGSLYSCSTHSKIYKTDGSSTWSDYANLAGTGLSDPMTTRGDSIYRNSSNVTDRLALPAAGQVIGRVGSDLGSLYPPGYELDYVPITSNVTVSATTEGTANTVVTSSSVTFDGAPVLLHFFAPGVQTGGTSGGDITILLRDDTGSAVLGDLVYQTSQAANSNYKSVSAFRRFTPAAGARVYSVRAFIGGSSGTILAAGGGTGNTMLPAFLRITKV